MAKKWTKEEEDYLRKKYPGRKSVAFIAKKLGRTEHAIIEKAYRLHIVKGLYYTEKQIEYLEKNSSKKSYEYIAKRLNRSYISVKKKMMYLGLGQTYSTDRLTLADVSRIVRKDHSFLKKSWIGLHGLPAEKVGRNLFIDQQDLIDFMKCNPTLWDATKVDDTLFGRYEWFQEKRKEDFELMVQKRWKDVI